VGLSFVRKGKGRRYAAKQELPPSKTRIALSSLGKKALALRKINPFFHQTPKIGFNPSAAIVRVALLGLFGTIVTNSSPSSNLYLGAGEAFARRNFGRRS
jgi:hypothetical protein